MKEFDYKSAINFLKEKDKRAEKARKKLFIQAKKDFEKILNEIIKFKPKKVYQWGSLLNESQFDENSDIDIAVEGLNSVESFFKIHGIIEDISDFPVDFVEIETISEVHGKSIKDKGVLVYEER